MKIPQWVVDSWDYICGHAVWSKVAAAVFVAIIFSIWATLSRKWGNIWSWVKWACPAIWSCLTYSVGLPVWFLILVGCCLAYPVRLSVWLLIPLSGLFLWFIVGAIRGKRQAASKPPEAKPEPTYFNYREDRFQDIDWQWKWQWTYSGGTIDVDSICPFCPDDGMPMLTRFDEESAQMGQSVPFVAYCEHCKRTFPLEGPRNFNYSEKELRGFIYRQIYRKLNTGEWRAVVEAKRAAKLTPVAPVKPPEPTAPEPVKPPKPTHLL
jgi:hypothetical protein